MDEDTEQQISFDATHSGTFGGAAKASGKGEHKRKPKGCKCRGDCCNKRCGCNSLDQKCSVTCNCTSKCRNRIMPLVENGNESRDDDDGSNIPIKKEKPSPPSSNSNASETENSENENADNKNNKSNATDETYLTTKTTLNATTSYLTPKMARFVSIVSM